MKSIPIPPNATKRERSRIAQKNYRVRKSKQFMELNTHAQRIKFKESQMKILVYENQQLFKYLHLLSQTNVSQHEIQKILAFINNKRLEKIDQQLTFSEPSLGSNTVPNINDASFNFNPIVNDLEPESTHLDLIQSDLFNTNTNDNCIFNSNINVAASELFDINDTLFSNAPNSDCKTDRDIFSELEQEIDEYFNNQCVSNRDKTMLNEDDGEKSIKKSRQNASGIGGFLGPDFFLNQNTIYQDKPLSTSEIIILQSYRELMKDLFESKKRKVKNNIPLIPDPESPKIIKDHLVKLINKLKDKEQDAELNEWTDRNNPEAILSKLKRDTIEALIEMMRLAPMDSTDKQIVKNK